MIKLFIIIELIRSKTLIHSGTKTVLLEDLQRDFLQHVNNFIVS